MEGCFRIKIMQNPLAQFLFGPKGSEWSLSTKLFFESETPYCTYKKDLCVTAPVIMLMYCEASCPFMPYKGEGVQGRANYSTTFHTLCIFLPRFLCLFTRAVSYDCFCYDCFCYDSFCYDCLYSYHSNCGSHYDNWQVQCQTNMVIMANTIEHLWVLKGKQRKLFGINTLIFTYNPASICFLIQIVCNL